jgi:hypothetical protein
MVDRSLPTGTLTVLFTDLEGSTRLLLEQGDAYGTLLEAAAALMTEIGEPGHAAVVLGAAEVLREQSGHAHRPWELRGRARAEAVLASHDVDAEREAGRTTELSVLVARVVEVLERVRAHAH